MTRRVIWNDMIDTMEAMPGWGPAAPDRCDATYRRRRSFEERGKAVRMADPEIIAVSPETRARTEASPCLRGVSANVSRPVWVDVSYIDHVGIRVRQKFEDMWAVSVMHQIDHLNGKLYVANLSRTKREMLIKKSLEERG